MCVDQTFLPLVHNFYPYAKQRSQDIIFLASQPNFRAEGRGFLWARKSVLEGFGGKAEGFLEREECVDEEDGLSLGAERAEGKVVGFGDNPCLQ